MLSPSRSRLSVLLGGRAIIVNKQIRHIMCQNSLLFLGADTRRAVLLANVGLPRGLGREAGTHLIRLIDRHTGREGLVLSSYVSLS
jgi:hypothetical protein